MALVKHESRSANGRLQHCNSRNSKSSSFPFPKLFHFPNYLCQYFGPMNPQTHATRATHAV